MTQTFAVNSNNDLYIGVDGNLAIVTDLEAVKQDCEHVAKTMLESCVLQTNYGLPYFQVVFNGTPQIPQFQAALRQAFLNVNGVMDVISLSTNKNADILTYSATIETAFGAVALSEAINLGGIKHG
jgi:hypothetical protein